MEGYEVVGLLSRASACDCCCSRVQLHAHFLGVFKVVVPKPEAAQGRFARELSGLTDVLQSTSCCTRMPQHSRATARESSSNFPQLSRQTCSFPFPEVDLIGRGGQFLPRAQGSWCSLEMQRLAGKGIRAHVGPAIAVKY